MSGVFGILDSSSKSHIDQVLSHMGAAMAHREWFVVETHLDEQAGVGLGRIGIGIFNQERQPHCSETGNLMVFLSGELYGTDETRRSLQAKGYHFRDDSDLELVLRLYQEKGDQFIHDMEGAFVLAIWDRARGEIVIANDRFGLYPLYYAHRNGCLIFAPEVKAILCDERFPRRLDWVALAQYVRFQHLLGERTFFEDIELLPNASLLTYNLCNASCTIRPYWTFEEIPYRPEVNFNEAAEETGRLLRCAVTRLSGDAYRPGVYLSGGLDSRTILGLSERRPIVSLTYGASNCRDVYYAAQIAKAVGSQHHWVDFPDGNWVKEHVDFHLDLTEGFHSWIHAHGISTLSKARELMDVNLTGWDGGTLMGHQDSIEPLQISAVDEAALTTRLFYLFNQKYTWPSITEAEEHLLYCEPIRKKTLGLAFDSFRTELSVYLAYRPDLRGEYFCLRNHCSRLTQNMVTFARSHIEVRFPFFDYSLFDFLYSLPAELRGPRRLYRAMIQRETPRLAYIPYDHDEFLPTTHQWVRAMQMTAVKLRRRLNRRTLPIFPERHTLYADYENYLRGELRDWAEGILYHQRTAERGIFNPSFLGTLMNRHLSNLEEWTIGKIAPLISYEMMLRRIYDS
jgi:asparagine synthase (glutamine-hydrolysing)